MPANLQTEYLHSFPCMNIANDNDDDKKLLLSSINLTYRLILKIPVQEIASHMRKIITWQRGLHAKKPMCPNFFYINQLQTLSYTISMYHSFLYFDISFTEISQGSIGNMTALIQIMALC